MEAGKQHQHPPIPGASDWSLGNADMPKGCMGSIRARHGVRKQPFPVPA
jgi:hypothetical protein